MKTKSIIITRYIPISLFIIVVLFFFRSFFLHSLLPIPADDIVGLYYPYRDAYAKQYPNGIPYKNFLITDPVRQQYPWRYLAISLEKKLQLPLWNPYTFSGSPLLANGQSAAFYPLNVLFFILPFPLAWSAYIFLGPLLGGIFLYCYVLHLRLRKSASLLGALTFVFSGFFISWMEWGTLTHTLLWLPLILLSADKIVEVSQNKKISNFKFQISNKKKTKSKSIIQERAIDKNLLLWSIIFVFALSSSFLAGHLQTFLYVFVVVFIYSIARWIQYGKDKKLIFICSFLFFIFLILTAIQWIPLLQFILLSARNVDVIDWRAQGWFIPWQNLIQFITPDFFGNPATLNYWGVWNYGEFVGYVGIFSLLFGIYALFFRRDRKTLFFGSLFFLSLFFAFPTFLSQLPYLLHIPFLSTSQPTRLLSIIDFSLAILAALGFDLFLKYKKDIIYPIIFLSLSFIGVWAYILYGNHISITTLNLSVAKHNMLLTTVIFLMVSLIIGASFFFRKYMVVTILILIVTFFDLFRFADKFIPFVSPSYLYPSTGVIQYLQSHAGNQRIMETDKRILPPNFSDMYALESVDGYDPLYLLNYGEFIAASERGKPDIAPPFGFNRIITPENYNSRLINLLGVKYILSFDDINSPTLMEVFQDRQTKIYENSQVLPRMFFVQQVLERTDKQETILQLFNPTMNLFTQATISEEKELGTSLSIGTIQNIKYTPNSISFKTKNSGDGFLVLTDNYYPTWHATIDGVATQIYQTDYTFRGIFIPKGEHQIMFYDRLW